MTEVALGIDIGTGSTKVGLVDRRGRVLAVGRSSHVIAERRPGWSESEPEHWLSATAAAATQAFDRLPADTEPVVRVVGFSGQMHGVVLADGELTPLRPAVLWPDRRSQPRLHELRRAVAAYRLTELANPVVAGMAGPTLSTLVEQEPDVVARTRVVLQAKDWVRSRLTGEVLTDASDASATLLWDHGGEQWSADACSLFEVDRSWLPTVAASDSLAGTIRPGILPDRSLDELLAGVPVAVGAADTAAALLGAGLEVGETQVSTGTGGQVATLIDRPVIDPELRTHLFRAADHGPEGRRWYAMAAVQNVGIALEWALELLGVDHEQAAEAVARSEIGSDGLLFLPYLSGERTPHLDAELSAGWTGLRPTTPRHDLLRSVYEGTALALADAAAALSTVEPGDTVLLAGGGSVAPLWRQLLADAMELTLVPHDAADASVRGAGLLAWSAVAHHIDPSAALTRGRPVPPLRANRSAYRELRRRFGLALPVARPTPAAPAADAGPVDR